MRGEGGQGVPIQLRHATIEAQGGELQKVLEQQGDVLAALTQWWQFQRHHVEAVVKVATKLAAFAQLVEVGFGGRDYSAVDVDRLVRTKAFQAVLLQHAQQLDLQGQRHALYLVEKQTATVGMLDLADAALAGTGEGVRFVAEYLALEQALRQAAAVEGDELFALASAEVVQAARDQFLAGAGFALDQHVGVGIGDVGDQFAQLLHGRRTTDDALLQRLAPGQLAPERADFAGQAALFQSTAHDIDQALGGEGFFHEVIGAIAHRANGHADVAVTGDQHHRQAGVALFEPREQLQAIDAGQADVADDDAGEILVDALQGLLGAGHADAVDVFQGQRLLAAEQYMGIVFDDQNGEALAHVLGSGG